MQSQTESSNTQKLDDYLDKANHLPPAPRIMTQLLNVLEQPDIDSNQIVDVIKYDSALTARVLHTCNTAYFGTATPSDSLQSAVTRLGLREVYRLVVGLLGEQMLTPPRKGAGLDADEFWDHCVTTAVAAQIMAKDLGDDDNLAFTAGLLHDLGKTILCAADGAVYAKLVAQTEAEQSSLLVAEKAQFGFHHAELGGRILGRWKFIPSVMSAVWFHHQPSTAKPGERLAAYIYLGNLIAYFLGHGHGAMTFASGRRAEALGILNLNPDKLPQYTVQTQEQYKLVGTLFRKK